MYAANVAISHINQPHQAVLMWQLDAGWSHELPYQKSRLDTVSLTHSLTQVNRYHPSFPSDAELIVSNQPHAQNMK